MKKRFVILCLVCTFLFGLTGCETEVDIDDNQVDDNQVFFDKFAVIETRYNAKHGTLYTVYDKDTMVMYYYLDSMYNHNLCPVYDENGNVMIYPEKLVED